MHKPISRLGALALFFGASWLSFAAVASNTSPEQPPVIPPVLDATAIQDGQGGRPNLDPCDDFYQFSCGGWLDRTEIPAEKSGVARSITAPMDNTDVQLNKILQAYAKGDFSVGSSASRQVRDLYRSCMNMEALGPAAVRKAKSRLALIQKISSKRDLAKWVAQAQKSDSSGASPFFAFGSAQDLDDSTKVIGDLLQGGISLGQRDYYLKTDAKSLEVVARYKEHVAKIFMLAGLSAGDAAQGAETVLQIETELAKASYSMEDAGDPSKTHHSMDLAALEKLAPHFDWATYFKAIGNSQTAHMNVDEPEFIQAVDRLLATRSPADIKTFLSWRYLHGVSSLLAGEFRKEDFRFWSAYLAGAKKPLPLWKLCTQTVKSSLGYALAEAYVQTFDGQTIKAKTEAMIVQIKAAFATSLTEVTRGREAWMDEATLKAAIAKMENVAQKVGAPVKWRDYSSLRLNPRDYMASVQATVRFEIQRDMKKIGKPVDKTEWAMMPWEVNAYYDRSRNEFNFPFGILQPPNLDVTATDGVNFGSFGGGTIGHELSHGFDNSGSQYDKDGNLKNWWSAATLKNFQARTACFVEQANQYQIKQVGMNVNGAGTLEENLSDQGGVKFGYVALENILQHRPEAPRFSGRYTERQTYWLAYAQSWCTKSTTEQLRRRMITDVHPPAEFRVNAVMMNRPEFARDFACRPGSRMNPANKCVLW